MIKIDSIELITETNYVCGEYRPSRLRSRAPLYRVTILTDDAEGIRKAMRRMQEAENPGQPVEDDNLALPESVRALPEGAPEEPEK